MARGSVRQGLAGGAVVAAVLWSVAGWSQQLIFDVETTLEVDDNKGLDVTSAGTTTSWDTTLGVTYTRETSTSSLTLMGQGVLRFAQQPGGSATGFEDPFVSLAYRKEGRTTRLEADARYRRSDLDFLNLLDVVDGDPTETDLAQSQGTRVSSGFGLTFEAGVDAPLGVIVTASVDDRAYQGTTDPDLYDQRTTAISATGRLDISPRTEARLTFGIEELDADNTQQTERRTGRISLGLSHALSPINNLDASLGYTRIDTDELVLGMPVERREAGVTGSLGVTREMRNGSASVALSVDRDSNGARTELRFGRMLEVRAGELDANVGVSWGENADAQLVGALSYSQEVLQGNVRVDLARTVSVNADSEDIAFTRLGLAYTHQINAVSGFGLSLDWAMSEDGGAGAAGTTERQTFRATYSRELTTDWDLTGGYQYRRREGTTGPSDSNSIFLTLTRSFEIR